MGFIKYSIISRGNSGVCSKCGSETDDLLNVEISDESRVKRMALCKDCAKSLYYMVKKKNDALNKPEKPRSAMPDNNIYSSNIPNPHPANAATSERASYSQPDLNYGVSPVEPKNTGKKKVRPLPIIIASVALIFAIIVTAVVAPRIVKSIQQKRNETVMYNYSYSDATDNAGKKNDTIVEKVGNSSWIDGSHLYFGTYPQSDVTSSLGSVLNSQSGTWKSYGYYSGTGNDSDGQMTASDYMRYKDVAYNGNKYRGVTFDSYRPYCTGYTSGDNFQQSNGYTTGNVYWFKYEPLKWRVLDPSTGLVMCETIIDSQPCNNYIVSNGSDSHGNTAYWGDSSQTYYANNYAKSSIREWLNDDFYNTAFSAEQKANINTTTLNNDGYYTLTGTTGYEDYDSSSTNDKIFLLSYDEVLNISYGFSTSAGEDYDRRAKGSDYAKCQGLYVSNPSGSSYDGCSPWLLRSPGDDSDGSYYVDLVGYVYYDCTTSNTGYGVRPAIKLNLKSIGE